MSRARDQGPSKTRRKRDAEALQSLGEGLAELPAEVRASLDLPERLAQALEQYASIGSHEARRRQRQFIGRLMRDIDPAPLQAFLDARRRPGREAARLFRLAEEWRDRLVSGGEPAQRAFLAAHPGVDPAALTAAVSAAVEGRSGASKRLFRMVRASVESPSEGNTSPRGGALLE